MRLLLAALVSLSAAVTSFAQTTWYVDAQNCTGSGGGTAGDPFCRIQEAVAAAHSNDEIVVLPGIYREAVVVPPIHVTIRSASSDDRAILEGIADADGDPLPGISGNHGSVVELRDFVIRSTSSAVALRASTLIASRCDLIENEGHVVNNSRLGGGVLAFDSQVTLEHCLVSDNWTDRSSGVHLVGGEALLTDCEFVSNYGSASGSSCVDISSAVVEIRRCLFSHNGASDTAGASLGVGGSVVRIIDSVFYQAAGNEVSGAMAIFNSDVGLSGVQFIENRGWIGAGMGLHIYNAAGRSVVAYDCLFDRNRGSEGGAVNVQAGNARFVRCQFSRNESHKEDAFMTGHGGAVFIEPGASAEFDRCTFFLNSSHSSFHPADGGAVWGPALLKNCVFFRNEAIGTATQAGAVGGGAVLVNCIAWDNSPTSLDSVTTAEWSDIQGGWPGTGNFDADPMLWGPEHGDLHLLPGSPCIDAGDPNLIDEDGTRIDVGAFPFDASYCGAPGTYCVAKENSAGCVPAISWAGTPSVAGPDDFHIVATNVLPDARGILVWGTGASAVPFHGGTLCIAPPRHRSSPLQASAGGACEGVFDFHFTQGLMQTHGLTVGDRLYLQFWYRDPLHSDGTGAGLTDGLEASICVGQ